MEHEPDHEAARLAAIDPDEMDLSGDPAPDDTGERDAPDDDLPEADLPEADDTAEAEAGDDLEGDQADEDAPEDPAKAEEAEAHRKVAATLSEADRVRMVEAILFASADPVSADELADRLPEDTDLDPIIAELQALYAERGVNLVQVAGRWCFRTAPDMGFLLQKEKSEPRKLSRAAIETLAIIAYHQPVTRAEIEELRGVTVSKGTLDVLLDVGWVRMRGRRAVPGRPITYGTSDAFLEHFGLAAVGDLPGMEELKAAGLLDWRLPPDFSVPAPAADGQGEGDGDFDADDEDRERDEETAALSDEDLFAPETDDSEADDLEAHDLEADDADEADDARDADADLDGHEDWDGGDMDDDDASDDDGETPPRI